MVRWLYGAIGIVLIIASVISALSIRRFVASATPAEGRVVALVTGGSHPRIRFAATDGTTVTFAGNGLIFGYTIGQEAAVLYNPINPQTTATLQAPGSLWFTPLVLFVIGMGWLFVPLSRALF